MQDLTTPDSLEQPISAERSLMEGDSAIVVS
jgi:hypothetical protein